MSISQDLDANIYIRVSRKISMAQIRRGSKDLTSAILAVTYQKPKTINEIAGKINANWDTVLNKVNLLKSLGLLQSEEKGDRTYYWNNKISHANSDTLFSIPISEKERKNTEALFAAIGKAWSKKLDRKPGKMQMHKAAVSLARELKLGVPRGWYLWGELCLLQYSPAKEYVENKAIIDSEDERVQKIVTEISKLTAKGAAINQYEQNHEVLYMAKVQLEQNLLLFDVKNADKIIFLSHMFAANFKENDDNKDIVEILNNFAGSIQVIVRKLSKEKINQLKPTIIETFNQIWKLIALYNFCMSLSVTSEFGQEVIRSFIKMNLEFAKQAAEDCLMVLLDLIQQAKTNN